MHIPAQILRRGQLAVVTKSTRAGRKVCLYPVFLIYLHLATERGVDSKIAQADLCSGIIRRQPKKPHRVRVCWCRERFIQAWRRRRYIRRAITRLGRDALSSHKNLCPERVVQSVRGLVVRTRAYRELFQCCHWSISNYDCLLYTSDAADD